MNPNSDLAEMYGKIFQVLADQVETIQHQAWHLFEEALQRDIDPTLFKADYALVLLDLAKMDDKILDRTGKPMVEYISTPLEREKSRVREALSGVDIDDYDD